MSLFFPNSHLVTQKAFIAVFFNVLREELIFRKYTYSILKFAARENPHFLCCFSVTNYLELFVVWICQNHLLMHEIIADWSHTYFFEPILLLVLSITLIIALKNDKKHAILKSLPFYISSLLLVFLSGAFVSLSWKLKYHFLFFVGLSSFIDYTFTFIELITFSIFFYQLLNNRAMKKLIVISNFIFSILFFYMFFSEPSFHNKISDITQSKVYTLEGIILLVFCIFYFFELFKKSLAIQITNEPAFWVSTGLFFFLTCTLPFSLIENYIRNKYPELIISYYSIFYIFYILLFSMLIRAYLCKPQPRDTSNRSKPIAWPYN